MRRNPHETNREFIHPLLMEEFWSMKEVIVLLVLNMSEVSGAETCEEVPVIHRVQ